MSNPLQLERILFASKKVLVIDPADTVRNTIVAMLKELGFQDVQMASSQKMADEHLLKQQYDVIISEHSPPKINGIELLRNIRSGNDGTKSAFIIISSNIEQGTVLNAVKSGVSEFIVKPFSLKMLKDRVKRAIVLPLKAEPEVVAKADKLKDKVEQSELPTVLVVDDVPANIKVVSEVIKSDYKVMAATSGEKALKICLGQNQPDLVLLDIMMPDMDGLTVCRKLKSHPLTQHLTIMFISAMDQTADVVKGLELGAVDYITKPINPPILKARVKNHMKLALTHKVLREQVDLMMDFTQMRQQFDQFLEDEVKSPLSDMGEGLGNLLVVRDDPAQVARQTEALQASCNSVTRLLDNFQLVSKIESGDYELNAKAINLDTSFAAIASQFSQAMEDKSVALDASFDGANLVTGEQNLVDQLCHNLLWHAVQTAPEHSIVTVRINTNGGKISVSVNNLWRAPVEVAMAFFEKCSFLTASNSQAAARYTIRLLVEQMQGKVTSQSDDIAGCTIALELPRVI